MNFSKTKTKIFLYLICAFIILSPLTTKAGIPFLTGPNSGAFEDLNSTAGKSGYSTTDDPQGIVQLQINLTKTIIQYILGFLGIIFLILIIIGGYQWMTAGGNEETIGKAKKRIINATMGLAIVLMAYAISYFIIYFLTENTISNQPF